MPKKKKPVHKRREVKSSPLLLFIRRQFWFLAVLVGLALVSSLKLTVTEDFRSGTNVLGVENGQEISQNRPDAIAPSHINTQNGESEIETPNGIKFHTKTENSGATQISGSNPTTQFQFEVGDKGQVELQAQDRNGRVLKTKFGEAHQLKNELEQSGVNVSTEDGNLDINEGSASARSHFPLSINPTTRQLTVTTPAGTKTVAVLPNQAIQNFLDHGITPLSTASGFLTRESSPSANPMTLTLNNNDLVYEVHGQERHNLLGFIPVTTNVTAFVSAENGGLVSKSETLFDRLISVLSF